MSWVKHRDKLHEAALSSIKSISKIKYSSKNGIPQRPPSPNQATLTSAPRLQKIYHHGEEKLIFNLFGIYFIKLRPDVDLSVPAKVVFNELEMSRVEILGSNYYKGSKRNINEYLRTMNIDDKKSPHYLALCSNLWLKDAAGINLSASLKEHLKDLIKLICYKQRIR
jgi:cobaltochelatase CobT